MKAPEFWWRSRSLRALALSPVGWLVGRRAAKIIARPGERPTLPVVCIGNFVVGGAGKTPTAIAVAQIVAAAGMRPAFLTRGYSGRARGPLLVDTVRHTAADVGDEALLLARVAPTVVARRRPEAMPLLQSTGADLVVMDDGFQNPSLTKTLSLVVVDAAVGVGNGRVMPAGPLRAPLGAQLPLADAVVIIGDGEAAPAMVRRAARAGKPVLRARMMSRGIEVLAGGPVFAYAGIGRPEKFFDDLAEAGVLLAGTRAFADHHPYSAGDAREILAEADRLAAALVTTEKDAVRLARAAAGPQAELASRTIAVGVDCVFEDEARVLHMIGEARARWVAG